LTVVAAYRWLVDRRLPWLTLAGLLAGFALSTKLSAVLLLLPVGAVIAIRALTDARRRSAGGCLALLSFGCSLLVSGAPWPVLRFVQTGNPVFPFLNGVFKSPLGPPVNEMMNLGIFGLGTDVA